MMAALCVTDHQRVAVIQATCGLQQKILAPTPTAGDKFGRSVAIGSVGGFMVVGEKDTQVAYVYVESGETWSNTDTLVAGGSKSFGESVAAYDTTIVISNHEYDIGSAKGHAYIYKYISGKGQCKRLLFLFVDF